MHEKHTVARNKAREKWYKSFKVRICIVERDYEWERENTDF
jgi:heme-degrading monooxygenase HmoA